MKHCLDLLDLHHDYPVFRKCEVDNVHMVYRTGHSNLYLRHSRIRHLQHDNKTKSTADTPLGLYQGVTEQVVMSRTPGSFRTVLVPRGSSKAEWES